MFVKVHIMKMNLCPYIVLFLITVSSCKQDTNVHDELLSSHADLSQVYEAYKLEQSANNTNNLLVGIGKVATNSDVGINMKENLLEAGLSISKDHKLGVRSIGFLYPLIRDFKESPNLKSRIHELTQTMFSSGKSAAGNVLASGYLEQYGDEANANALREKMTIDPSEVDGYIQTLATKIFEDPDEMGLNRAASMQYVDACQAYALAFPNKDQSPEYLYKAAEVAKSIRSVSKSLSLYDWILKSYPDHERAATSLFIKGFILENELKNQVMAKEVYNSFIEKYPDHQLADDVKFLIENLGKSDEEIARIIEEKQKNK